MAALPTAERGAAPEGMPGREVCRAASREICRQNLAVAPGSPFLKLHRRPTGRPRAVQNAVENVQNEPLEFWHYLATFATRTPARGRIPAPAGAGDLHRPAATIQGAGLLGQWRNEGPRFFLLAGPDRLLPLLPKRFQQLFILLFM